MPEIFADRPAVAQANVATLSEPAHVVHRAIAEPMLPVSRRAVMRNPNPVAACEFDRAGMKRRESVRLMQWQFAIADNHALASGPSLGVLVIHDDIAGCS